MTTEPSLKDIRERIKTLDALTKRNKTDLLGHLYSQLYPWQLRFNEATKTNLASLLIAANQVGKSQTGCIMDSYHLTGAYPEDWGGHKFIAPPLIWLLGFSGEKTRDLLQQKLFGRLTNGKFEGGYIPADLIVDYKSMSGVPGACREVRVKHKAGVSICQFWSYSQGQHALMGDIVDWYHVDEEPKDQTIYPQVITRTLNGDGGKGGRGILTLTPENGKTELVCRFMDDIQVGQYMQTATWNDAPHLNKEAREIILSAYPKYQRDMRSKGVPLMGAGLIYEHAEEDISCKRFEIPKWYWLINGMDFGWDHPQAHIQLAIDPETACVYVIHAWKKSKKQPFEAWEIVKGWARKIPTAWPHDGQQHKIQSGGKDAIKTRDMYEEAGWDMLSDHATWVDGGNGVEAGLMEINNLMSTEKFKVFDDLPEVLEEIREYHRKSLPSGLSQIVKVKDDYIDAIRYAYMMLRFAEQKYILDNVPIEHVSPPPVENALGY